MLTYLPNCRKSLLQHFAHIIHELSFGSADEYEVTGRHYGQTVKKIMDITDPLDGFVAHTDNSQYMFQVSVVPLIDEKKALRETADEL